VIFFAVFLYGIGFIGGFLTPTSLDSVSRSTLGHALLKPAGRICPSAQRYGAAGIQGVVEAHRAGSGTGMSVQPLASNVVRAE
jgi:hypothetical protein